MTNQKQALYNVIEDLPEELSNKVIDYVEYLKFSYVISNTPKELIIKNKEDFLGNKLGGNCIGCAIANGNIKIPGGIIYEGEYVVLGNDPEIPILGFLIVTLKRHINSFSELNKEERNEIGNIIVCAEKALKDLDITQEITLVQEERSKHFHIWIFPRHSWMNDKFGTGIEYLRDICGYAKKSATKEEKSKVLNITKRIKEYFEQHYIDEE